MSSKAARLRSANGHHKPGSTSDRDGGRAALDRIMVQVMQTDLCIQAMTRAGRRDAPISAAYEYIDRLATAAIDAESETACHVLMQLMFGIDLIRRGTDDTENPPCHDKVVRGLALLNAAARGIERVGEINHRALGLTSICELDPSPSDVIGKGVSAAAAILVPQIRENGERRA